MSWRDLEASAPELARLGKECLARTGVAVLATLRPDGSPRISVVEPHVAAGRLVLGLMPWSAKARDLAADPRCALHSVVAGPDTGESELEVHAAAVGVDEDAVRAATPAAWWADRPAAEARLVELELAEVVVVEWDTERGRMIVRRWSPAGGVHVRERPYP